MRTTKSSCLLPDWVFGRLMPQRHFPSLFPLLSVEYLCAAHTCDTRENHSPRQTSELGEKCSEPPLSHCHFWIKKCPATFSQNSLWKLFSVPAFTIKNQLLVRTKLYYFLKICMWAFGPNRSFLKRRHQLSTLWQAAHICHTGLSHTLFCSVTTTSYPQLIPIFNWKQLMCLSKVGLLEATVLSTKFPSQIVDLVPLSEQQLQYCH